MKTAQNIAHIILVGNSTEEHTISYRYRENNVCRQSYCERKIFTFYAGKVWRGSVF